MKQSILFPLSLLIAVLGLSSCAYVIAPQWRRAATPGLTFGQVQTDPEAHKGSVVIWGGVILDTENSKEGTTLVMLETAVDRWGYPRAMGYSPGRFLARSPEYLDPAVYRSGLSVTLAGEVAGKEVRPLDRTEYAYPVVAIRQLFLWSLNPYGYPHDYYHPYGYYPWDYWDNYWGPFYPFYPFYFKGGIILHGGRRFEHREPPEHREPRHDRDGRPRRDGRR